MSWLTKKRLNWSKGQPILFETMIFNGNFGQDTFRCATWEEAEEQHQRVVEMVKASLQ